MNISMPLAIITEARLSKDGKRLYCEFKTGEDTFNLSIDDAKPSDVPLLKPVSVTAVLSGFVWNNSQILNAKSIKFGDPK